MTEPVCIHLACGRRYIPGWIHVDIDAHPHVDHVHGVDTLPMFADNYADLLYASHIIAYFDRFEIQRVLREWLRVLKPGGVLRLSTPDFARVVEVYGRDHDLSVMLGFLYGRYETRNGCVYHRMTYDFSTLERALKEAGFRTVTPYDWRQTVHRDYDDYSQAYLPHMDKEHGTMMSLNVEAVK